MDSCRQLPPRQGGVQVMWYNTSGGGVVCRYCGTIPQGVGWGVGIVVQYLRGVGWGVGIVVQYLRGVGWGVGIVVQYLRGKGWGHRHIHMMEC